MSIDYHKINTSLLNEIAIEAGKAIMEVYNSNNFKITHKVDASPLTVADKRAHEIIVDLLARYFEEIPIMSEEGNIPDYKDRKDWKQYWCVDPLDGTKEFINKNGEFTVNIALIDNNFPVLGLIYIPVKEVSYLGISGVGAYRIDLERKKIKISTNKDYSSGIVATVSRSHLSIEDEEFLSSINLKNTIGMGSSIKFCLVGEGRADLYKRSAPTMEWDTAAGQAIVESAGGVVHFKSDRLKYNKEDLRNESFYCVGSKNLLEL
jgi:3'(2'), 5'-bisphosphate nucleotidase